MEQIFREQLRKVLIAHHPISFYALRDLKRLRAAVLERAQDNKYRKIILEEIDAFYPKLKELILANKARLRPLW